jgi:hypothetical protein
MPEPPFPPEQPFPPGPPPPPSPRGGKRVLGAVLAVVVTIGGFAVAGTVRWALTSDGSKPRAQAPVSFTVGGCVRLTAQPTVIRSIPGGPAIRARAEYAAARCGDGAAYAKITKMGAGTAVPSLNGDETLEKLGCAIDTDEVAQVKGPYGLPGQLACLRRLKGPHPGDPGQGGGLVRAGDCVQVLDRYTDNVREAACTNKDWIVGGANFGKEWFGQIVGRAGSPRGCERPAIYTITLRRGASPVLCIAKNGGWLPAVGDCVDGDTTYAGITGRRKCDDKYLAVKITALIKKGQRCPGGTPPRKVPGYLVRLCVKSVR